MGTTNAQSWMIPEWATTYANGSFTQGGGFAEGAQGSYTLTVEIDGKRSNTIAFVVSDCRR